MAVHRRTKLLEAAWRAHRGFFKLTGGRIGRSYGKLPVALVTATGRKSGQPRAVTIPYFRDGGAYVFIASNAGEPRDPDWVLNLRADPAAILKVKGTELSVRAREADGDERERLWARAVELQKDYAEYAARVTTRRIPVMVLEPDAGTGSPPAP